jgi:Rrf2 family transcriptional regulator, iron-sulfur cluster assembly transcription factor
VNGVPIQRGRRGPRYAAELLQSPLYSRTCKEAFRIMERLAAASLRRPGSVRNEAALALETGLSLPELEQVVYFLRLAGLVEITGGRTAGIRLARPPSRISLLQVVRAIDGTGLWGRCILGLEECSEAMPCPAHPVWKQARSMLEEHLDTQSLIDLTRVLTRRRHPQKSIPARPGKAVDISDRMPSAGGFDSAGDL